MRRIPTTNFRPRTGSVRSANVSSIPCKTSTRQASSGLQFAFEAGAGAGDWRFERFKCFKNVGDGIVPANQLID